MIIKVTQKHIDEGKPEDSCHCPVALAINDFFRPDIDGYLHAEVFGDRVDIITTGVERTYRLPDIAEEFVSDFDDPDIGVGPFEFQLDMASFQ